jgi:hypothetical protein
VNLISATAGALAALAGAYGGLGVWTLVLAPIVLFATRAIGMTWAARSLMWPSFDFRGAGAMARFGGLMAAGQMFWFVQSQADVFIAGRLFDPHTLGIYTTSLFLTQILVQKFVPALNEVAFSAYARMQDDAAGAATAFAKSVRDIAADASDVTKGTIASQIASGTTTLKRMDTALTNWDDRLASRRTALTRQYAALNVQLQSLQSQQSSLSGAIAKLG